MYKIGNQSIMINSLVMGLLFSLWSSWAFSSTYVAGTKTTIRGINSYNSENAEGDIRILVNDIVSGCESGYFLTSENVGIGRTLSIALSALHTGSEVVIDGYKGVPWRASKKSTYCEIHAIRIVK
ncbi:conserved hypothetical protein [Vibrio chagasii]|uniref:hypothetical protein n=1 Tax=Vibrio TaxID=662 RepID=UPI000CF4FE10|nr:MULTISPECIES: hypothetical protein [Vibrio]CAH6910864.1 conserved hypothetical protein [Vibrio chagasii]NOI94302.1 hypothetical protein [Vibrio sp. T3Y01]PQJ56530.1 hypothetical protein BTO12_02960 [Vibrio splendidus]CAH6921086.1 conserved hypothetical protein [Vibrio chagasii]CAH7100752.1 conserved hypothetical protein [Vibrio chagasii]